MWKIIFIGKPRVFHIYVSFPQGIHSGQEILWPGAAIPFWHWVRWTYAAPSPPPKGELSELSDRNSIIMSVSVIISHHKISSYCFIYQVMCHRYNSRENISYIHNSIYIYIYISILKKYIYIYIYPYQFIHVFFNCSPWNTWSPTRCTREGRRVDEAPTSGEASWDAEASRNAWEIHGEHLETCY